MARTIDTAEIALADIDVGERLRPVDPAWVEALATTMQESGHYQPITTRKTGRRFALVFGAHRLEARRLLGMPTVRSEIVEATPEEARLMEIDENLIRRELSALDRATFLAERKAVYEELHPDTRAGVAGGKARQGAASDTMSFAESTAEKIGLSRKSIERAVRIHFQIEPAIRRRLAGTAIAHKQSELLALAKEGPQRQTRIVDMLLRGSARSVRSATQIIDGHAAIIRSDDDRQFMRLMDAWDRASAKTRRRFIEKLAEDGYRADTPAEAA